MSQTHLQTTQNNFAKITTNLARMRCEKGQLEVRQTAINRTVRRMETRLATTDDFEEMQNLQDIIDNLHTIYNELDCYCSNLESELDKVRRGLSSLAAMKGKPGKLALESYITEDTELSVRNIEQIRSYYDQVIETIRQLKDEPLGYEG